MTFIPVAAGAPAPDSAVRASLEAQRLAIARLRLALAAAVERLPRSAGAVRGGPAPADSTGAPWKGPARLAFEASLYDLERAAIDARDALVIAEDYTRRAIDGLDRAG